MSLNFNAAEEYRLEDERVLLRPLQAADFDNLLSFALNEPEIWTYSSKNAGSEELMSTYITEALQLRDKGLEYPFIVFDKKTWAIRREYPPLRYTD